MKCMNMRLLECSWWTHYTNIYLSTITMKKLSDIKEEIEKAIKEHGDVFAMCYFKIATPEEIEQSLSNEQNNS